MHAKIMRKRVLVPVALAAAVLLSGIAVAFWSGSGTGTGTATVGTGGGLFLGAAIPAGIYPGGNVAVGVTVSNPSSSAIRLGAVHLANVSVDAAHAACVTSDFSMPDIPENDQVPAGAVNYQQGGGTLYFADTAVDQNACKGATLTLALTSS